MGYFKPMSTVKMRQAPWDCPACGASPMFHPPILGKGGGFVFSATHNIQHETPPQITLQVYDTAVKAR